MHFVVVFVSLFDFVITFALSFKQFEHSKWHMHRIYFSSCFVIFLQCMDSKYTCSIAQADLKKKKLTSNISEPSFHSTGSMSVGFFFTLKFCLLITWNSDQCKRKCWIYSFVSRHSLSLSSILLDWIHSFEHKIHYCDGKYAWTNAQYAWFSSKKSVNIGTFAW